MKVNYIETTCEMALIVSLSLAIKRKVGKGRLSNLLERLQKKCGQEFKKFPPIHDKADDINKKMVSWSENCGWDDNVETITFVSFLLGLIDQSEYKYPQKIIDTLNDIYDFITVGRDYHGSSKLADHALKVWSTYDKVE